MVTGFIGMIFGLEHEMCISFSSSLTTPLFFNSFTFVYPLILAALNLAFFILFFLFIEKKVDLIKHTKSWLISSAVALCSYLGSVYVCDLWDFRPMPFDDPDYMLSLAKQTEEQAIIEKNSYIIASIVIGIMILLIGHFLFTFGKKINNTINLKLWQRICFSVLLAVLNAPYWLLLSFE